MSIDSMKYTPVKHTPLELLLKVGFMDTPNGRGYQLTIGSPKNTDVVLAERMHAYIDGDTIDYHRDKKGKGKSHVTYLYLFCPYGNQWCLRLCTRAFVLQGQRQCFLDYLLLVDTLFRLVCP